MTLKITMLVILGPFLINYIGMDTFLKMPMKIGDPQVQTIQLREIDHLLMY